MIEALEPLASLPGVRLVILVAYDGVPVVVRGKAAKPTSEERTYLEENTDSLCGLAANWIHELGASIAPLGWNAPWRAVMRAARGTLVMINAPGSMLALVIDPGGSAEVLRLPMEGAVARMQRILRGGTRSRGGRAPEPDPNHAAGPAAAAPESPQAHPGHQAQGGPSQALPSPGAIPPSSVPSEEF